MDLTRWAVEQFLRLVLITARVSGLFLMAPMMAGGGIPRRVKVALAGMLALVILPVLPAASQAVDVGAMNLRSFLTGIMGELIIGAAIGLVAAMMMAGIELAGLFIGRQTGLAMANVLNPLTGSQVSVMGRFYGFLALMVFLIIGGHRMLIMALCRSFEAVPIGGFRFNANLSAAVVALSGRMFEIALSIAAPVIVTLVLTTIALGLIARTVPQLNILAIGFPVRIGLGWLVVLLSLGASVMVARELFVGMFEDLAGVVDAM